MGLVVCRVALLIYFQGCLFSKALELVMLGAMGKKQVHLRPISYAKV